MNERIESSLRPVQVLVVNDDVTVRQLTRRMLDPTYRVLEAGSVEQALEVVANDTVELVLMAAALAGLNAFEACRRIKERPSGSVPALLISGLVDHAALDAGADDFLSTPISQRELEVRVAALIKTRERGGLVQEQLRELHKLLVMKDDLVDLLVHDLRSPLTAVTCSLRNLEEKVVEPGLQEDIQLGIDATLRVTALAEDLLTVRLLEEGVLRPTLALCSPLEVVDEVVEALRMTALISGVTVVVNGPRDLQVRLDRKLVFRAVDNLLSNAVRYTRKVVEVSVTPQDQGVEITIADRGAGIVDAFKPMLFEKFGSVEARAGRSRRGVGLGLYMVRLVAAAHGGQVSVEDRAGGGSLFRLTLSGQ